MSLDNATFLDFLSRYLNLATTSITESQRRYLNDDLEVIKMSVAGESSDSSSMSSSSPDSDSAQGEEEVEGGDGTYLLNNFQTIERLSIFKYFCFRPNIEQRPICPNFHQIIEETTTTGGAASCSCVACWYDRTNFAIAKFSAQDFGPKKNLKILYSYGIHKNGI